MDDVLIRFVVRLEEMNLRVAGGQRRFRCPAHYDADPSLAVSVGDTQRLVFRCFAGCTPDAILTAMGWTWADVFPGAVTRDARTREDVTGRVGNVSRNTGPRPCWEDLEAQVERGEFVPVSVLRDLPTSLTHDQQAAARQLDFLMGMSVAVGELRPLPCSAEFLAKRAGWLGGTGSPDKMRAWRVLRALERLGLIHKGPKLRQRGDRRPTQTYIAGPSKHTEPEA
jgi:hypothetical protein